MSRKKIAAPATVLEHVAKAILDNDPIRGSLELFSKACGLTPQEQMDYLHERCGWSVGPYPFAATTLRDDRVALRRNRGEKISQELSESVIRALADLYIHPGYDEHPSFPRESNRDADMLRAKFIAWQYGKIDPAQTEEHLARTVVTFAYQKTEGKKERLESCLQQQCLR